MKKSLLLLLLSGALLTGHAQEVPPSQAAEPEKSAATAEPTPAPLRNLLEESSDTDETPDSPAVPASPNSSSSPAAPSAPAVEQMPAETPAVEAAEPAVSQNLPPAVPAAPTPNPQRSHRYHHTEVHHAVVRVFGDAHLDANSESDAVVSVFGSSSADGRVEGPVVAVFGDSTARAEAEEGVVAVFGHARAEKGSGRDVVAVFGDAYVDGHVEGNVVSVFGAVQMGPRAQVDGNVVSIGNEMQRADGSRIHGEIIAIPFPVLATAGQWFRETVGLGRLLSYNPRIIWPWVMAFMFLGFYVLLSLVAGRSLEKCAQALEQRPGSTILSAFICVIALPPLMLLLSLTFVGVPVLLLALLVVGLFGKAAFLIFLGRRLTTRLGSSSIPLAAILGGFILLLLYTIPVIGMMMWMTSAVIGVGMVIQSMAMNSKRDRPTSPPPGAIAPAVSTAGFVSPAAVTTLPPADPSQPASSPQNAGAAIPSSSNVSPGFTGAVGSGSPSVSAGFGSSTPNSTVPPPLSVPPPLTSPNVVLSQAAYPRAGFWIRVLAGLIDIVLISVLTGVIGLGELFLFSLAAYCVVMWSLKGTTVGGAICGLKLVRLDDRKIDWSVSLVRGLASFLSIAVIGLGFIWVAFDDERQSWHDKIAGTTIIKMPKGLPLI